MITVKIEKEIKQENHIIGQFTLRQSICFIVALIIDVILYFMLRPKTDALIPITMLLGVCVYFFGFYKKMGINAEYFLIKKIKEFVFANKRRKYRTKNKYVELLNDAYKRKYLSDMQDKKYKKAYLKSQKKAKKKKSYLVAYK